MVKNIQIISKHSQVKELGNALKYNLLKELIQGPATNQQLADTFGISKQKMHYNLNKLLEAGLIQVLDKVSFNSKEIYYRATAQNYILDLSLGEHLGHGASLGPQLIHNILEREYKLDLGSIAQKILVDSLGLKTGQKLFLVTGSLNLPLVEKILIEAGKMKIQCTLVYQSKEMMKAKYDQYSLNAFRSDYEYFLKNLKTHHAYLNLNPESRYIQLKNREKFQLRGSIFNQTQSIVKQKKLKTAMILGLLNDTLTDTSLENDLQLWKALDVDYANLRETTLNICKQYKANDKIHITGPNTDLSGIVDSTMADCGSFDEDPCQSPIINYPGGEVLIIPKEKTINGTFKAKMAYAFGEKIINPEFEIVSSEISSFKADANQEILAKAIADGGPDGRKIALICLGTNPNISLHNIDISYNQKSQGLVSLWWGNSGFFGGNVTGKVEWFVQLEEAKINIF